MSLMSTIQENLTLVPPEFSVFVLYRNSASTLIKQSLVFAGNEKGKLMALRQTFSKVFYCSFSELWDF